jgi:hypothetical protein
VKLNAYWDVSFVDDSHQVVLTKVRQKQMRPLFYRYRYTFRPTLRRVDSNGSVIAGQIDPISPSVRQAAEMACYDRWGEL